MNSSTFSPAPTVKTTFEYGDHTVRVEAGHIAMQAAASVWLTMGDCIVMVNVAHQPCADSERDFFPLTVNYKENFYAAGKIPGGFTRREGRPNEREVIICRLIDRSIRPMFPKHFKDEVQITASLLQHDPEVDPDIPAMLATSAALALSNLPYKPIASARVGYSNQSYILNTPSSEQANTRLDMVVSGTEKSAIMVESAAMELTEEEIIGAIEFAHSALQEPLKHILALQNTDTTIVVKAPEQPAAYTAITHLIESEFSKAIADVYTANKKSLIHSEKAKLIASIQSHESVDETMHAWIGQAVNEAGKQFVRNRILVDKTRIDGRKHNQIRPITSCVQALPKGPHGSALFTRGETQALVTVTLGGDSDAQLLDEVPSNSKDNFMLQYNFPPYSVGECGASTSPKRREIGHGKLARKAIQGVIPSTGEQFPYTLRVVSEILSSNGSSSMATVCGTSLALMDAGVPLKDAVAGIAMGLVVDGENYTVLSDILGDEDHLGDMDFKVAGTKNGITALQMDLKVTELPSGLFQDALSQAHEGRLHILDKMSETLANPRAHYAPHAPQMKQIQIPQSKISAVIGRGGATIKDLIEKYQVGIDINDSGIVKVSASNASNINQALDHIQKLTIEVQVDQTYEGKIVKIMEFGAFVNILPGKDAFLHISQIASHRVENIQNELSEGQIVRVKVIEIDEKQKRVKVTMKNIPQEG